MTYVCHGMQELKLHQKIQVRHQGSFLTVRVVKGWKSCLGKVMASLSLKDFENRLEICLPGIDVCAVLYSAETQEMKVFCSCCDSETGWNNNALASFL